jgi:hypothetical protein
MHNLNNDFIVYHLATGSNYNDYFTVAAGAQGTGLFSNVCIPVQTILMTVQPQLLQNAVKLFAKEGFNGVAKLRKALSNNPEGQFLFINHANAPNIAVNRYGHVIALHHIFIGEELLVNYSAIQVA